MVKRTKTKIASVISILFAFIFSFFTKAPIAQAESDSWVENNVEKFNRTASPTDSPQPSDAAGTQPASNPQPSDAAGTQPAASPQPSTAIKVKQSSPQPSTAFILKQISPQPEVDQWLQSQGIETESLSPQEYQNATVIYRLEKISERLDNIERQMEK